MYTFFVYIVVHFVYNVLQCIQNVLQNVGLQKKCLVYNPISKRIKTEKKFCPIL